MPVWPARAAVPGVPEVSTNLPPLFGAPLAPVVIVEDGDGAPGASWAVVIYRGDPDSPMYYRTGLSEEAADRLAAGLREHLD